jgi:ribonuclease D
LAYSPNHVDNLAVISRHTGEERLMEYITGPMKFGDALKKLSTASYLSIDGEFTAYRAQISVIAIKSDVGEFVIDCFQNDIRELIPLFCDDNILKILHAGINDIKMLRRLGIFQPKNIFDTQIASTFVNYDVSQSLDGLISHYLDIDIPKTQTVSDWSKRPLSRDQLNYAFQDVEHLFDLRQKMLRELEDTNRIEWFNEELENIYSGLYEEQAELIKYYDAINYREEEQKKILLMRLYKWRSAKAQHEKLEDAQIIEDKYLFEFVKHASDSLIAMRENQHLPKRLTRQYMDTFIKLYTEPVAESETEELNKIPVQKDNDTSRKMKSSLLKSYVTHKAEELKIDPQRLLAGKEIDSILKYGFNIPTKIKSTWRNNVFDDNFKSFLINDHDISYDIDEHSMKVTMQSI